MVTTMTGFYDRMHIDRADVVARTIFVDTFGVKATDFALSDETAERLYESGRKAATTSSTVTKRTRHGTSTSTSGGSRSLLRRRPPLPWATHPVFAEQIRADEAVGQDSGPSCWSWLAPLPPLRTSVPGPPISKSSPLPPESTSSPKPPSRGIDGRSTAAALSFPVPTADDVVGIGAADHVGAAQTP